MKATDFIKLVEELQPANRKDRRTPTQDACWYVAYQIARGFSDYTTKDIAEAIVSDGGLIYRMNTEEDMQMWLDNQVESNDFGEDETAHYRAKLREWFR